MNRSKRRLEIARRIAAETFAAAAADLEAGANVKDLSQLRRERSAAVVADSTATRLYNMAVEHSLATVASADICQDRLEKAIEHLGEDATTASLLRATVTEMVSAFPRCNVYIGLLQPGGDSITFPVASPLSDMEGKTLYRGEGVLFTCIDEGRVVCIPSIRRHNARISAAKKRSRRPGLKRSASSYSGDYDGEGVGETDSDGNALAVGEEEDVEAYADGGMGESKWGQPASRSARPSTRGSATARSSSPSGLPEGKEAGNGALGEEEEGEEELWLPPPESKVKLFSRASHATGRPPAESMLAVPLQAEGRTVGVIVVDSFLVQGVTDLRRYQRNPEAELRLLSHGDVLACQGIAAWRLPGTRHGGEASREADARVSLASTCIRGQFTDIAFENNGIPYVGGPRFTVEWEDGLVEKLLRTADVQEMLKATPLSLGAGSYHSRPFVQSIRECGEMLGKAYSEARKKELLRRAETFVHTPTITANWIYRRGMELCLDTVLFARFVELWSVTGFDYHVLAKMSQDREYEPFTEDRTAMVTAFSAADQVELSQNIGGWSAFTLPGVPEIVYVPFHDTRCKVGDKMFGPRSAKETFAFVVTRAKGYAWPEDVGLLDAFPKALSDTLQCTRKREERREIRRLAEEQVSHYCEGWPAHSLEEILDVIMQQLDTCRIGANAYVGLLRPGGDRIDFVSDSANSKMRGKKLRRGKGLSFGNVDECVARVYRSATFQAEYAAGMRVNAMYHGRRYPARIIRVRDKLCADIEYELDKLHEGGVALSRLDPMEGRQDVVQYGDYTLPIVVVPLRHQDKVLGVLTVDTFDDAPRGYPEEEHPEFGVMDLLQQVADLTGYAVDMKHRARVSSELATVAKNFNAGPEDLLKRLCTVLWEVFHFAREAWVLEWTPGRRTLNEPTLICNRERTEIIAEREAEERAAKNAERIRRREERLKQMQENAKQHEKEMKEKRKQERRQSSRLPSFKKPSMSWGRKKASARQSGIRATDRAASEDGRGANDQQPENGTASGGQEHNHPAGQCVSDEGGGSQSDVLSDASTTDDEAANERKQTPPSVVSRGRSKHQRTQQLNVVDEAEGDQESVDTRDDAEQTDLKDDTDEKSAGTDDGETAAAAATAATDDDDDDERDGNRTDGEEEDTHDDEARLDVGSESGEEKEELGGEPASKSEENRPGDGKSDGQEAKSAEEKQANEMGGDNADTNGREGGEGGSSEPDRQPGATGNVDDASSSSRPMLESRGSSMSPTNEKRSKSKRSLGKQQSVPKVRPPVNRARGEMEFRDVCDWVKRVDMEIKEGIVKLRGESAIAVQVTPTTVVVGWPRATLPTSDLLRSQIHPIEGFVVQTTREWRDVDIQYALELGERVHGALEAVQARDARCDLRAVYLERVRALCKQWRSLKPWHLVQEVVDLVVECYQGSNAYASFILPGGNVLAFIGASKDSLMRGQLAVRAKHLDSGSSGSFACVDHRDNMLISSSIAAQEAGLKVFVSPTDMRWPFVSVPLMSGVDMVRGTLGCDNFGALGGDTEREADTLDFFRRIGILLGTALDRHARLVAKRRLTELVSRPKCTLTDIYLGTEAAIRANVPFTTALYVAQVEPREEVSHATSEHEHARVKSDAGAVASAEAAGAELHPPALLDAAAASKAQHQSHAKGDDKRPQPRPPQDVPQYTYTSLSREELEEMGFVEPLVKPEQSDVVGEAAQLLNVVADDENEEEEAVGDEEDEDEDESLQSSHVLLVTIVGAVVDRQAYLSRVLDAEKPVELPLPLPAANLPPGAEVPQLHCVASTQSGSSIVWQKDVPVRTWTEPQSLRNSRSRRRQAEIAKRDALLGIGNASAPLPGLLRGSSSKGARAGRLEYHDTHDVLDERMKQFLDELEGEAVEPTFYNLDEDDEVTGGYPDLDAVAPADVIQIPCPTLYDTDLTLEVFTRGRNTAIGELLGHLCMRGCIVPHLDGCNRILWLYDQDDIRMPLGVHVMVRYTSRFWNAHVVPVEYKEHVIVEVLRAEGLAAADSSGYSDPRCEIFWNNEPVGVTKTIKANLNPVWENERFEFVVPPGDPHLSFRVEVYDMDYGGLKRADFLGQTAVTEDLLLHPPEAEVVLPLDRNPALDSKLQTLVQGSIVLKVRCEQRRADGSDDEEKSIEEKKDQGPGDTAITATAAAAAAAAKNNEQVAAAADAIADTGMDANADGTADAKRSKDQDSKADDAKEDAGRAAEKKSDEGGSDAAASSGGGTATERNDDKAVVAKESGTDADAEVEGEEQEAVHGTTIVWASDVRHEEEELYREDVARLVGQNRTFENCFMHPALPRLVIAPFDDVGLQIGGTVGQESDSAKFAFAVVRQPGHEWEQEVACLSDIVSHSGWCISVLRGRQRRAALRQYLLERIMTTCTMWPLGKPIVDLCHRVTAVVNFAFPGSSVYCGLLQHGAQRIRFVASAGPSHMTGRELYMGEGVSFSCCGVGAEPVVFRRLADLAHATTEEAQKHLADADDAAAQQQAVEVHASRPGLQLDGGEQEITDDDILMNQKLVSGRLCCWGDPRGMGFPLLLCPLGAGSSSVGVLGIHDMQLVGSGVPAEDIIEPDAVGWFESVGRLLGTAIRDAEEANLLEVLREDGLDWNSTLEDLFGNCAVNLFRLLPYAKSTEIWHVLDEPSKPRDPPRISVVSDYAGDNEPPVTSRKRVQIQTIALYIPRSAAAERYREGSEWLLRVTNSDKSTLVPVVLDGLDKPAADFFFGADSPSQRSVQTNTMAGSLVSAGGPAQSSRSINNGGTGNQSGLSAGGPTMSTVDAESTASSAVTTAVSDTVAAEALADTGTVELEDDGTCIRLQTTRPVSLYILEDLGIDLELCSIGFDDGPPPEAASFQLQAQGSSVQSRVATDDKEWVDPELLVPRYTARTRFVTMIEPMLFAELEEAGVPGKRSASALDKLRAKRKKQKRGPMSTSDTNMAAHISLMWQSEVSLESMTVDPNIEALSVHIMYASELGKADTFGKSDPFVEVFYRGELVGKTKVIKNTLDPEWEDEVFRFPVRPGDDPQDITLQLEVWDMDVLGKGGFLGMVTVRADVLLNALPDPATYTLESKPALSAKENSLVTGTLTVVHAVHKKPTEEDNEDGDVEIDTADVNDEKEEDTGLEDHKQAKKKRSLFGGRGGKGAARSDDNNDDNRSVISDSALTTTTTTTDADARTEASATGNEEADMREILGRLSRTAIQLDVVSASDLAKADLIGRSDPYVIVFWRGEVIGRTEVIYRTLDPEWTDERFVLPLSGKEANGLFGQPDRDDEEEQTKHAKSHSSKTGSTDGSVDYEEEAEDLRRTAADDEKNIVMEVWDHDKVGAGDFLGIVKIDPKQYLHPTSRELELQLKPKPGLTSKQLALVKGSLRVRLELLEVEKDATRDGAAKFPWRSVVELRVIRAEELAKADTFGKSDPYVVVKRRVRQDRSTRSDGGSRGGGGNEEDDDSVEEEIGRTKTIKRTLNPLWEREKFYFPLERPQPPRTFLKDTVHHKFGLVSKAPGAQRYDEDDGVSPIEPLILDVWDEDMIGSGDFLGRAVVPPEMLLHPPDTLLKFPLQARPNARAKEGKFVKGDLFIRLRVMVAHTADQIPREPAAPDVQAIAKAGDVVMQDEELSNTESLSLYEEDLMPQMLEVALDPLQEEKRFEEDHLALPGIMQTVQERAQLANEYDASAAGGGFLSELAYGQVLHSLRAGQQTVIHGRFADVVVTPLPKPKEDQPKRKLRRTASYQDQRDALQSRESGGRLERMDTAARLHTRSKEPRRDPVKMGALVVRFVRGQISDRDRRITALAGADVANAERQINERRIRSHQRASFLKSFRSAIRSVDFSDWSELTFYVVHELLEVFPRCEVTLGLLSMSAALAAETSHLAHGGLGGASKDTVGQPQLVVRTENHDPIRHRYTIISNQSGKSSGEHVTSVDLLAAEVLRHGYIIYAWDGKVRVGHMRWRSVRQLTMPFADEVPELEPCVQEGLDRFSATVGRHSFVLLPIMATAEKHIGFLKLTGLENIAPSRFDNGPDRIHEGPEEGVVSTLANMCKLMGPALSNVRQRGMLHALTMPHDTREDLVEHALLSMQTIMPQCFEVHLLWLNDPGEAVATAQQHLGVDGQGSVSVASEEKADETPFVDGGVDGELGSDTSLDSSLGREGDDQDALLSRAHGLWSIRVADLEERWDRLLSGETESTETEQRAPFSRKSSMRSSRQASMRANRQTSSRGTSFKSRQPSSSSIGTASSSGDAKSQPQDGNAAGQSRPAPMNRRRSWVNRESQDMDHTTRLTTARLMDVTPTELRLLRREWQYGEEAAETRSFQLHTGHWVFVFPSFMCSQLRMVLEDVGLDPTSLQLLESRHASLGDAASVAQQNSIATSASSAQSDGDSEDEQRNKKRKKKRDKGKDDATEEGQDVETKDALSQVSFDGSFERFAIAIRGPAAPGQWLDKSFGEQVVDAVTKGAARLRNKERQERRASQMERRRQSQEDATAAAAAVAEEKEGEKEQEQGPAQDQDATERKEEDAKLPEAKA